MRIGIFGGSLDPVHSDHFVIMKKFITEVKLDKLLVIPTARSPFKSGQGACGIHRSNILKLSFYDLSKNERYFNGCDITVSNEEIERGGKSYTYMTVRQYRERFPEDELFYLMGADSFADFLKWRNPLDILDNCTLAVVGRGGYEVDLAIREFTEATHKPLIFIEHEGAVSSTLVREKLMLGLSDIEEMSPSAQKYVRMHGLYKGGVYHEYLKAHSKPSRLEHTAGVVASAAEYAKRLGQNVGKAKLAALLHDVAKYFSPEDFPECELPEGVPANVVHQYLGAYVAEHELNVTDGDVLNAIRYHTTGRPGMSTLEKIVFCADLVEPGRDYGEVEQLRLALSRDFEEGFKLCVSRLKEHVINRGLPVFKLTLETDRYYNGSK